MIRKLFLCLMILYLSAPSVSAQAKVGTVGAQFLDITPDVRGCGMASAGVALTDSYSGYFNPAAAAMIYSEDRFNISLGHTDLPADIDVTNLAFTTKIKNPEKDSGSSIHLGTGVSIIYLNTGYMTEYTYQQGPGAGAGQEFMAKDLALKFTVGAGFNTFVDISAGFTVKYINEDFADESANGVGFDIGLLFSRDFGPAVFEDYINENCIWIFKPSFGIALTNFGPDMTMVQQEYPLPKRWTSGFALELARQKKITESCTLKQISIIPAFEIEDMFSDLSASYCDAGLELGLYEAVYLRAGVSGSENIESTLGFSLSGRGLSYLLGAGDAKPGSLGYFFREKIKIAFHYARENWSSDLDINCNYYGLSIGF